MGVPNEDDTSFEAGVMIREYDPDAPSSTWKDIQEGFTLISGFVESAVAGTLPKAFQKLNNAFSFMSIFDRLMTESKELHKIYGPKGRHIYVAAVGVDPASQGKGLGKRIMQQVSDVSDATGLPAYLECASEKNRAVYEKSGYVVTGEKIFTAEEYDGPHDLKLFFMVRQPKVPDSN